MTYLFVFAVFNQLQRTHSLTASVSGSTPRGTNFFHKKFPVPPAKYAMIEVDVLIPRDQVPKTTLFMGIYTTEDNADIKRRCTTNMVNLEIRTCTRYSDLTWISLDLCHFGIVGRWIAQEKYLYKITHQGTSLFHLDFSAIKGFGFYLIYSMK